MLKEKAVAVLVFQNIVKAGSVVHRIRRDHSVPIEFVFKLDETAWPMITDISQTRERWQS